MTGPAEPNGSPRGSDPARPTPRRLDASMTLLTELSEHPLDPGYAAAADRREREGLPRRGPTRTFLMAVTLTLIGFLFVASAKALRPPPTAAAAMKTQLVARIDGKRSEIATREDQATALRRDIDAMNRAALESAGQSSLDDSVKAALRAAGGTAVRGPGVIVTLDDAADTAASSGLDPRTASGFPNGRVTSTDLQRVCNGLWDAGAEAIAVNGIRLTGRTAIRFAGQAILVDYRPLTKPYTVTAIGDPDGMRQALAAGATGTYLADLTRSYGIPVSVTPTTGVELPAGTLLDPLVATPPAPPTGASTTTPAPSEHTS